RLRGQAAGKVGAGREVLALSGDRRTDGAQRMMSSRPEAVHPPEPADGLAAEPLTERDAEEHIHGICFKTGPPGKVGVELEWLVRDGRDPGLRLDQQRVAAALAGLAAPGALPGGG